MNRVRALLISFLGAAVLMAALSYDAVLWAQDFAAGFPGGGGRGIGLLNALYCQLASPCVLTGDNASGTGTLRIRPSDEDTQLVLCEASNNAATEVCSSFSHQNVSATASLTYVADNGYSDSAGTFTRYNTGFGAATFRAAASSTQAQNFTAQNVYSTNGTHSGDLSLIVTGVGTSTFYSGASTTVTNDIRGPILNGGSATCNGILAGSLCVSEADGIVVAPTSGSTAIVGMKTPDTYAQAGNVLYNTSNSPMGGLRYYGSTSILTAAQNKTVFFAQGAAANVIVGHGSTDIAAGSPLVEFMDGNNFANTVATLDGAGNLFLATGATRTKGTITLAAGTGTATVSSGCTPACSDTTAVNAVQCSVSGTTLTANGTGTDVISYLCF